MSDTDNCLGEKKQRKLGNVELGEGAGFHSVRKGGLRMPEGVSHVAVGWEDISGRGTSWGRCQVYS